MLPHTTPLTLLVHNKIAIFEWGQVLIDQFSQQAWRNGFSLQTVYRWQNAAKRDGPIVLIGVDELWIDDVLKHLLPSGRRIVSLNNVNHPHYKQISHISADQEWVVEQCLQHLHQCQRTHPAFFGMQNNDTSDRIKAETFAARVSKDSIYTITDIDEIHSCAERFIHDIDRYDSVLCANDIEAIYLLSRLKAHNIPVPERLMLIGNGGLWLCQHTTPTITTVSYDSKTIVKIALMLCKQLLHADALTAMNALLKGDLTEGESTEYVKESSWTDNASPAYLSQNADDECDSLLRIQRMNDVFSTLAPYKRTILHMFTDGVPLSQIAECIHLSESAVKYHLKRVYKQLDVHNKRELKQLIEIYGITY